MRIQHFRVELESTPAFLLGAIHRDIRILQQRLHIATVGRIGADADAGRGAVLPAGEDHGLGQRFQDLARHRAGLIFRRQSFREHGEFVAAESRDHVDLAHTGGEPFRDRTQYFIARVVAEAVVDVLEAIQIEEQDGQHFSAALGALQRLVQRLPEQAAVRQLGQFVVVGEEARAFFLLLAFGDVLQHAVHAARRPVLGAAYVTARKDMHDLLVRAHEPELVAPLVVG